VAVQQLVLLLLALHFLVAVLRIVPKHWGKRLDQIQRYESLGRYAFFFGEERREAGDVLQWLAEHTPANSVILWRGEWRGAMEFAPALLWPRMVYDERAAAIGQTEVHGRPIAAGNHPRLGEGQLVIVGTDRGLHLELR
jgi:hypothetical protein